MFLLTGHCLLCASTPSLPLLPLTSSSRFSACILRMRGAASAPFSNANHPLPNDPLPCTSVHLKATSSDFAPLLRGSLSSAPQLLLALYYRHCLPHAGAGLPPLLHYSVHTSPPRIMRDSTRLPPDPSTCFLLFRCPASSEQPHANFHLLNRFFYFQFLDFFFCLIG